MSDQKTQPRVLRIGIIQDGKIVQERLVASGEAVTVGEDEGNTFVFSGTKLGTGSFTLFSYEDGAYRLHFTKAIKGKVTAGGAPVVLDKARKDSSTEQVGDVHHVTLTEEDRGKLKIAPVTVLFQFVAPPPVAAATSLDSMDFRPRLIEDDDPLFLGILAVWSALAIVFGTYVYNAEPPEISIEEIPDRFTRIVIRQPTEPEEIEDLEDVIESEDGEPKKVKAKEPEPTESKAKSDKPKSKVEEVREKQAAKDKIVQESKLFQQLRALKIGTTGENAEGTVLLENADGSFGEDLDAKLRQAAEQGAAVDGSGKIRGGSGVVGGTGDRSVGELEEGADLGTADLGSAPKIEVKPRVDAGDLDFGGGDVKGLAKVVRRYQGQLKYCYEKQLKVNPQLRGRVVIGWTVEAEEALDVYIAENGTGDEEFANCLKKKVQRWRFADVEDGDAKQPFVFQPEE